MIILLRAIQQNNFAYNAKSLHLVALCYYQIIEFNALRKKNGFLLKLFRFSISKLLSLSGEALDTHHRLETDKRKHGESHNIYRHISANKPKN